MDDAEKIMLWQNTGDSSTFVDLTNRFKPVVNKIVNQYRTAGVAPSVLRAKANAQLIKAMKSYNPTSGTQPITHVYNNLKKVSRIASESLSSGHIPEQRAFQRSTFQIALDNLGDRLGREPSIEELSEEVKWDKKETARMFNELSGETTASNAEFDFYGNSARNESGDRALVDYLYHELGGDDKVIFEHTFGYGGKKELSNKEIAKKIGKNEMYVHRSKKKMSKKIRENR